MQFFGTLNRLADRRPFLLLSLSGLAMVFSFAPFPFVPLAMVGLLPVLIVLERRVAGPNAPQLSRWRRYWRAFKYAWVFFFVWNLGVNYWLYLTGHNYPDAGTRIAGFISGLMANLGNPVVQGLPLLVWVFLRRRLSFSWALVVFPILWVGLEYFHFTWELTWSWTTLGHAYALVPWYVQYIEWTGVLGASFHLVLVNLLFFVWWKYQQNGFRPGRRFWAAGAALLLLPVVCYPLLTRSGRAVYQPEGHLNVRIIQPNLDPYGEKFNGLSPEEQMARMDSLIRSRPLDSVHLVLLPETAIPGGIEEKELARYPYLRPLRQLVRNHRQLNILTGIVARRYYAPGEPHLVSTRCRDDGFCWDSWNAATLLHQGQNQPDIYQKARLVPFSERTPYMETLNMLKDYNLDLGGGFGSFAFPDSIRVLGMRNGTKIAPIICYESIFGMHVRKLVLKGARLLTIITNDGWWKQTSGYLQHSAFARFRAIETRRAIARSANTGESAFYDACGFQYQATPWWKMAVIDRCLPLLTGKTLYVSWGDWLGRGCLAAGILLWLAGAFLPKRRLPA